MKSLRLRKLVAVAVVAVTMATLSPIGASAEWKQDSNGWWNTEGKSYSIGWRNIDGVWYYFNSNGYMKTGWVNDGGTWYYMQSSGAMKTGWVNDGGTWYYLQSSGAMKTGWVNDGGTWYYLQASGAMKTGWINDNGVWYFAASSGAMQTGVIEVEGKVYYLAPSGAMQKGNVTIDGVIYTFAASGEAIGDKKPTPALSFTSSGAAVETPVEPEKPVSGGSSGGGGGSSYSPLSNLSDGKTHSGQYKISTSGIFGDASNVTTINGNITISKTNASTSDAVTLRNMNIDGTLTIDFGAGNVILDNVTVGGVNVSNVGSNSLHVKGKSSIKALKVNDKNNDAHIVIEGNAVVENTTVLAGAQLEVGANAKLRTITADSDFTILGAGQVDNVIVEKPGIKVGLQVTSSIGAIFVNKEAAGAAISISKETTVAILNVSAKINVEGNGKIVTANLGVAGITIAMKPTNIGILAGIEVTIGGQAINDRSNGVTIISQVPGAPAGSDFQSDINSKYMKYTDRTIHADFSGDTVTLSVVFDEPVDDSKTAVDDYVRQEVFVTNADGTDEGITYDSKTKKYTAKVGAKVYVSVRVYRDGQIGYVTGKSYTAVPEK